MLLLPLPLLPLPLPLLLLLLLLLLHCIIIFIVCSRDWRKAPNVSALKAAVAPVHAAGCVVS
jgi:hypothetical protein